MGERVVPGGQSAQEVEPDATAYCPSCGARGVWQKCKLVCLNERCSVRIILACVD
jgi:hypothetical protein